MDKLKFGTKLKELRDSAGHSQDDLGKELKVGPKQIQRYEKGEVLPDHENIEKICKLYDFDFVSLIYDVSREAEKIDFQKKYYDQLEKDNKRLESEATYLKEKLNSAEGQLRHVLLLTCSIAETNQDSLAQMMEKLKIGSAETITERHRKENLKSYSKMKTDLGIA